jgi:hypothetical protein
MKVNFRPVKDMTIGQLMGEENTASGMIKALWDLIKKHGLVVK